MTKGKIDLAPIVIFAFNRPEKLRSLINSLEKNDEYQNSNLYFFIDKYENKTDKESNKKVIETINNFVKHQNYKVIHNKYNFGLKKNILSGVEAIFKTHNKAIFLEDDLIVGRYFLNYMNKALDLYEKDQQVMHISGYNFPTFLGKKNSAYKTRLMNCWGWGTWKDRWSKVNNFEKNEVSGMTKQIRRKFNVYGLEKDLESQLIRNENKKINTWAIYWYQHIFQNNGISIQPIKSLVQNNGFDESGLSNVKSSIYNVKLNNSQIYKFPKFNKIYFIYEIQIIFFYLYKKFLKKFNN